MPRATARSCALPGASPWRCATVANAINVTILLWSAVLAFPAPWKMTALGLVAGTIIVQALNIVRFISLFYLGQ